MLKVRNSKYLLVARIGRAQALMVVGPITFLHLFTDFSWWQILIMYAALSIQAMAGLLDLVGAWGTFDINKEAAKK